MSGEDSAAAEEYQPGQEVVVCSHIYYRIETIDRVTATMVIINGEKFRRNNRRQVGASGWHILSFSLDPQDFKRARRQQAEAAMRGPFALTPEGVERMRRALALAEAVLEESNGAGS